MVSLPRAKWGLLLVIISLLLGWLSYSIVYEWRTNESLSQKGFEPHHLDKKTRTVHVIESSPVLPEKVHDGKLVNRLQAVGRDPEEWQGMPVNPAIRVQCHPKVGCGLALACVDGHCVGCQEDAECMNQEVCVLQHCVLEDKAECRTREDCQEGELCILSGLSSGPRGNAEMRSYCLPRTGGTEQVRTEAIEKLQQNTFDPGDYRPTPKQDLLQELRSTKRSNP